MKNAQILELQKAIDEGLESGRSTLKIRDIIKLVDQSMKGKVLIKESK